VCIIISLDKNEKIRGFFNRQYAKFKRTQPLINSLLLMMVWASSVYQYVAYRPLFSNVYIGLIIIFSGILFVTIVGSHVYVIIMGMIRTEVKEEAKLNIYNSWGLTAKEILNIKYIFIPILEGIYHNMPEAPEKENKLIEINRLKNWLKLGRISEEDFLKELDEWYITYRKKM